LVARRAEVRLACAGMGDCEYPGSSRNRVANGPRPSHRVHAMHMPPLSPPVNTAARRHRSGFSAVWRLNVLHGREPIPWSAKLDTEALVAAPVEPYFLVRISMSLVELARLNGLKLVPGMPVEAFIRTDERTMLSYFFKPLTDQARRAFREK
jgi:hypothetical protein